MEILARVMTAAQTPRVTHRQAHHHPTVAPLMAEALLVVEAVETPEAETLMILMQ